MNNRNLSAIDFSSLIENKSVSIAKELSNIFTAILHINKSTVKTCGCIQITLFIKGQVICGIGKILFNSYKKFEMSVLIIDNICRSDIQLNLQYYEWMNFYFPTVIFKSNQPTEVRLYSLPPNFSFKLIEKTSYR